MSKEVIDFYTNNYAEGERLIRHPLEFERSKSIISRYLTNPKMTIADIGCATGMYSIWLAKQGHCVHALDLVEKHIKQTKTNAENEGVSLSSVLCGNALKLPYENETFDIALQMGSLYHLQERAERMKVLQETKRILKPNGIAVCTVISRFAALLDGFKNSFIDDDVFIEILDECLASGKHSSVGTQYFTNSYMHTPSEIGEELEIAGFNNVKLIAIEGWFAFGMEGDELMQDERKRKLLMKYLEKVECEPSLMGSSGHIMAIAVK